MEQENNQTIKIKKKTIVIVGVCILFAVLLFVNKGGLTGNVVEEGMIKIPLKEISNQAKFYNEGKIKYFVVKASDGFIKTAFDACDVCYSSHKGYRQEGNIMICNNCGNSYPIDGLGTENKRGGGCWPGYLPSQVEGEYLIIKKTDINSGSYRF
ncbi:DUF2318 domain-containing protein [Candidatus Woesearchaeota archaeon]|nr:DUF2318 domain-containing protein [Candidatus Woesearchaeota archaeon]